MQFLSLLLVSAAVATMAIGTMGPAPDSDGPSLEVVDGVLKVVGLNIAVKLYFLA